MASAPNNGTESHFVYALLYATSRPGAEEKRIEDARLLAAMLTGVYHWPPDDDEHV